jgi:hypothetical protein
MAITRITTANAIPDSSVNNVKISNIVQSKNIIINGDMSLAQRGTSATGVGASDTYLIDRFFLDANASPSARFTMSQSTDVPTGQGFATSLKMDCTTAQASYTGNQLTAISQRFEGQNVQYLKYGTSSAQTLTLSFWVKSNKTGTYIAELDQTGNGRDQSQSYTISSANTWEKKTLTYTGDTASTLANDNTEELEVYFWLACSSAFTSGTLNTSWNSTTNANRAVGQVNLADSTSNEWYVTGVQLEAGTTASEFEFLPVDVNLNRCYRYYQLIATGSNSVAEVICNAAGYSTSTAYGVLSFIKEMRSAPSLDQTSGTAYYNYSNNTNSDTFDSFAIAGGSTKKIRINNADTIAITAGQSGWFSATTTGGNLALDSEL